MKASIKRKWLNGLRSKKYKQGKNFLQKDGCFCVVGVLCGELKIPFDLEDGIATYKLGEFREREELPLLWWSTLGVPLSVVINVIRMNDGSRGARTCSFAQIADYIEEAVEEETDKDSTVLLDCRTKKLSSSD